MWIFWRREPASSLKSMAGITLSARLRMLAAIGRLRGSAIGCFGSPMSWCARISRRLCGVFERRLGLAGSAVGLSEARRLCWLR